MQSRDELDDSKDNDPYAVLERAADLVLKRSTEALDRGEEDKISDAAVAMILTAAVKLYASKADGEGRTFRAVLGRYDEVVTGTEALSVAIEILRALKLGPLEFALWARRRPEDDSGDPA